MKVKNILFIIPLIFINSYSQINFQENVLENSPDLVGYDSTSIYSVDIDSDGDLDFLITSRFDNKIAWCENTYGLGNFGSQQIITLNAGIITSLHTSDIDGDNDLDIISTSSNKVAWYENIDGLGNFSEQIITTNSGQEGKAFSIDIDNDGDNDIVSISHNRINGTDELIDNKLVWYENLNSLGSFSSEILISTDIIGGSSIHAVDIDGDDDIDIISASGQDDKIAWYENTDGTGVFGIQQIITTNEDVPESIYATDLDGDNDMDIVTAAGVGDRISWYENTDGLGSFILKQVITTQTNQPKSVFAIDLDGDGDLDVLSSSTFDNKIAWYENTDGLGTFGTQQIIALSYNPDLILSGCVGDIDSDGEIDILFASTNEDKIALYKNLGPNLSINDNSQSNFIIYPNPVNNILNIHFDINISSILIYDSLGKLIQKNSNKKSIDISNLNQGLYFVKVIDVNRNFEIKKIIKD